MKPMKIMLGAVALSAIVAGNANAGVSKETCAKSDKTIWVENVQNADGTKGACVPKNACKVDSFKDKFCNTAFADIQVRSVDEAHTLIDVYAKNVLKWSDGCPQFYDIDVNNIVGQDYIGCYSNGNYMTFEIDDTNDHVDGDKVGFAHGMCIALGKERTPMARDVNWAGFNNISVCQPATKNECDIIGGRVTEFGCELPQTGQEAQDSYTTMPSLY